MRYQPRHAAPTKRRPTTTIAKAAALIGVTSSFAATIATNANAASAPDASNALSKIKYCESTNNYQAQNAHSTASGAYQFLDTTWRGLSASRGYAHAKDAPAAVQDAAAIELYNQAGTSPWAASQGCWGSMNTAPPTTTTTTTTNTVAPVARSTARAALTSGTFFSGQAPAPAGMTLPTLTPSSSGSLDPLLSSGWTRDPFAGLKLTPREQQAITSIEKVQKQQPEWSLQAATGKTVLRKVVTSGTTKGIPVLTHAAANFYSATPSTVANGDVLRGHYINVDWFKITDGAHKGQYVQAATLHRADLPTPKNGTLSTSSLAKVPDFMRSGTTGARYLNPGALKQLVKLDAAYRTTFGTNFTLNEGYRTDATQRAYYANLGPAIAAKPGTSNHEQGLAVDIASVMKGGSPSSAWMNTYASTFGWQRPAVYDRTTTEFWHFNNIG